MRNAPQPWTRDEQTPIDAEGYAVIRDAKGAPVAFVEKTLDEGTSDRIAGLIVASEPLAEAVKEVIFAQDGGETWDDHKWRVWRMKHGKAIAISMGMIR